MIAGVVLGEYLFASEVKPREVTNRDLELAQEMFNLGVRAAKENYDPNLSGASKGGEILSSVKDDPAMTNLLMELFECGLSVGERRKKRRRNT